MDHYLGAIAGLLVCLGTCGMGLLMSRTSGRVVIARAWWLFVAALGASGAGLRLAQLAT